MRRHLQRKIFILVGDHKQLPPLVRNQEAKNSGMAVSLFARLCNAYPTAVMDLEYQYRMNEDIMLFSNTLVYLHKLKCGSPSVAAVCPSSSSLFIFVSKNWSYPTLRSCRHCLEKVMQTGWPRF